MKFSCEQLFNMREDELKVLLERFGAKELHKIAVYDRLRLEHRYAQKPEHVVFRGCPLCGAEDAVPILSADGKHLAGSLSDPSFLDEVYPEHFTMVYNHCSHCEYWFISPIPQTRFIDHDHMSAQRRAEIEGQHNPDRVNAWMIDEGYRADKQRSFQFHFERLQAFGVTKDAAILDVGCGVGVGLEELHDIGYANLYGIEPDNFSVELIRKKKPYIQIFWGDIFSWPSGAHAGAFDLIMFDNVFEHLTRPLDGIAAAHRMLRQNGKLWLSVPNLNGPAIVQQKAEYGNLNFGHWNYYSAATLFGILKEKFSRLVFYDSAVQIEVTEQNASEALPRFVQDWVQVIAVK